MKTVSITLRIDPLIKDALSEIAWAERRSLSSLIDSLLYSHAMQNMNKIIEAKEAHKKLENL